MFEQAERTIGFLSDLSPEAHIGALLLALVIALTTAGTYRCLTGRPTGRLAAAGVPCPRGEPGVPS